MQVAKYVLFFDFKPMSMFFPYSTMHHSCSFKCVYVSVCMFVQTSIWRYTYAHTYICVYMHVHIYACAYVD